MTIEAKLEDELGQWTCLPAEVGPVIERALLDFRAAHPGQPVLVILGVRDAEHGLLDVSVRMRLEPALAG